MSWPGELNIMSAALNQISLFLIYFGGTMSWVIALGQLLMKNKQTFNFMLAGFMFSLGVVQIYHGMMVTGHLFDYPYLIFIHLSFLAWTGPTFFLCFKSVIGEKYHFRAIDSLHFAVGFLVLLSLIPSFMMSPEDKKYIIMTPPSFTDSCFCRWEH